MPGRGSVLFVCFCNLEKRKSVCLTFNGLLNSPGLVLTLVHVWTGAVYTPERDLVPGTATGDRYRRN